MVPLASLLGGQHQAILNRKVETLQATIAELKSTIAQQKRGMDAHSAAQRAGHANPESQRATGGEQASGASREQSISCDCLVLSPKTLSAVGRGRFVDWARKNS